MSEWISVDDRLPGERLPILMVAIGRGPYRTYTTDQYAGWYNDCGSFSRWPHPEKPTHWQPLPPPPSATK